MSLSPTNNHNPGNVVSKFDFKNVIDMQSPVGKKEQSQIEITGRLSSGDKSDPESSSEDNKNVI